jgi:hypothetical protein
MVASAELPKVDRNMTRLTFDPPRVSVIDVLWSRKQTEADSKRPPVLADNDRARRGSLQSVTLSADTKLLTLIAAHSELPPFYENWRLQGASPATEGVGHCRVTPVSIDKQSI